MKNYIVNSYPRFFKKSPNFRRFERDIDIDHRLILDQYSEYYFLRKIKENNDIFYLREIIRSNMPFLIECARAIQNPYVEFDDLINEGCLGIIKAAYVFDDKRGFKFLSYAVWHVRARMIAYLINFNELIRLPLNQYELLRKINKKINFLNKKYGDDFAPSYEVAGELYISIDKVENAINSPSRDKAISLDQVYEPSLNPGSINEDPIKVEDSILFEGIHPTYDDILRNQSLQLELKRVLKTLTNRESDILILYFGLGYELSSGDLNLETRSLYINGEDLLDKIGETFSLTRERVRQIKEKAIRRMRNTSRCKLLREYLG